ncbi:hypothetical protein VTN02DRAFT_3274 [Thermoascus thermophilus]
MQVAHGGARSRIPALLGSSRQLLDSHIHSYLSLASALGLDCGFIWLPEDRLSRYLRCLLPRSQVVTNRQLGPEPMSDRLQTASEPNRLCHTSTLREQWLLPHITESFQLF